MPRRAPSWAAFRPLGCSPLVRQRHAWAQACEGRFPSAHGHGSAGREPAGSWPAGTTAQAPPKPRGILRGRSCPSPRAMFDAHLKPSLRPPGAACSPACSLPARTDSGSRKIRCQPPGEGQSFNFIKQNPGRSPPNPPRRHGSCEEWV